HITSITRAFLEGASVFKISTSDGSTHNTELMPVEQGEKFLARLFSKAKGISFQNNQNKQQPVLLSSGQQQAPQAPAGNYQTQ
ncbi:MAG: hypothetical protein R3Y36_03700, partial [Spirochaetales bacterium]